MAASKAKSLPARLKILSRLRPKDFVPITPAIAEPTTGETMGQSAEKMAKIKGVHLADECFPAGPLSADELDQRMS